MDVPLARTITAEQVADLQPEGGRRVGPRAIKAEYWLWGGKRLKGRTGKRSRYLFPVDAWEQFWAHEQETETAQEYRAGGRVLPLQQAGGRGAPPEQGPLSNARGRADRPIQGFGRVPKDRKLAAAHFRRLLTQGDGV